MRVIRPHVKPAGDICRFEAPGPPRATGPGRPAERIGACASPLWPEESAAPGSSAACSTTSDRPTPVAGFRSGHLTVIGNTGDDITLFGLRVCPDIDTLLYTLGGGIHEGQGWGRADESHHLAEELAALGAEPQWFTLGDKDFGTHVYRSQLLGQGMPLSAVIDRLSARWGLGELGVRLLPMTDTPVETHVVVEQEGEQRAIHFQEWWVRHRAELPAERFVVAGPRPGDPRTRGARRDPRGRRRPAAAEQPRRLDRHHPRRARACATPCAAPAPPWSASRRSSAGARSAATPTCACAPSASRRRAPAVAGLYSDFLDGWLVDEDDPMPATAGASRGGPPPLLMSSVDAAAEMAGAALDLGLRLRAERAPA